MTGYRLSSAAEADPDEIWHYTSTTWSVEQARNYNDSLFDAFVLMSENPALGQRLEKWTAAMVVFTAAIISSFTWKQTKAR